MPIELQRQAGAPRSPRAATTQARGGPARLEHFEVQGIVGRGATGTVYLAVHTPSGQKVALKVLAAHLASDPSYRDRFCAEAHFLQQLAHPHIVPVLAVGTEGGRPFLATAYVEGISLAGLLATRASLSAEQCLGILTGALSGLAFVHARGVVHGDVTPGNIVIDARGTSMLSDFGHSIGQGGRSFGGTPGYLSPEAATGQPLDARSDVYSMGVVLYECLEGHLPFQAPSADLLVHHHALVPAPPLSNGGAGMAGLVAASLAKDPDERPRDAGEFLERLEVAAAGTYGPSWRERAALFGLTALDGTEAGLLSGNEPTGSAGSHPPPTGRSPLSRSHAAPRRSAARRSASRRLLGAISSHKVLSAVVALVVGAAAGTGLAAGPLLAGPPGAATAGPVPIQPATWHSYYLDATNDESPYTGRLPSFACPTVQRCLFVNGSSARGDGSRASIFSVPASLTPAPAEVADVSPGSQLSCPTPTRCFALTDSGFLESDDGGATWHRVTSSHQALETSQPTALSCPDETTCLAAFYAETLVFERSDDAGGTWQTLPTPGGILKDAVITSLACSTGQRCLALALPKREEPSADEVLFESEDGGQHWARAPLPSGTVATSISCPDADGCFVGAVADTGGRYAAPGDGSIGSPEVLAASPGDPFTVAAQLDSSTWGQDLVSLVSLACYDHESCSALLAGATDSQGDLDLVGSVATGDGWSTHVVDRLPDEVPSLQDLSSLVGGCPQPGRCLYGIVGVGSYTLLTRVPASPAPEAHGSAARPRHVTTQPTPEMSTVTTGPVAS